jgi:hypothetical protein
MPTKKEKQIEVGDLFVTESAVTIKLLPSKKSGSRPIRWFEDGAVTNIQLAAKDIAFLIGKVQGSNRLVKSLTVMTDKGAGIDLESTGLHKAIAKAGFEILR